MGTGGISKVAFPFKLLWHYCFSAFLPPLCCWILNNSFSTCHLSFSPPGFVFSLTLFFSWTVCSSSKTMAFGLSNPFPELKPIRWARLFNCLPSFSSLYLRLKRHKHEFANSSPANVSFPQLILSGYPPSPSDENTGSASLSPVTLAHSFSYPSLWHPPKYFSYLFSHSHSHYWHLNWGHFSSHFSPS